MNKLYEIDTREDFLYRIYFPKHCFIYVYSTKIFMKCFGKTVSKNNEKKKREVLKLVMGIA